MCHAGSEDVHCSQRWQLWPLLLGLMHWSPECGKATYIASQETVGNNMSCISICSTAFVAAVPAPDVTDEVRALEKKKKKVYAVRRPDGKGFACYLRNAEISRASLCKPCSAALSWHMMMATIGKPGVMLRTLMQGFKLVC